MRRSSMAAAALILLSGAALAQVTRTPEGKDAAFANQLPGKAAATNDVQADIRNDRTGNDTTPSTGDQKTEPAAPRR